MFISLKGGNYSGDFIAFHVLTNRFRSHLTHHCLNIINLYDGNHTQNKTNSLSETALESELFLIASAADPLMFETKTIVICTYSNQQINQSDLHSSNSCKNTSRTPYLQFCLIKPRRTLSGVSTVFNS